MSSNRYDPNPSMLWCIWQALRGTNNTTLQEVDVVDQNIQGKWIIITGANSGIGREAAKIFARLGAHLILACRDPPKHELHPHEVAQECLELSVAAGYRSTIEWWFLDMSDLASVEMFAQRWLKSGRTLDILCNNAGMSSYSQAPLITKDGFGIIHQVNFLSHVFLTLSLLESMAQSPEPRIVCTTSCHHFLGKYDLENFDGTMPTTKGNLYGNNKLYYQIWIGEFQRRLLNSTKFRHVTVNGVNPGYVNTDIWNDATRKGANSYSETFFKFLAYYLGISPTQGCLAIVHAAASIEFGPNAMSQGVGSSVSQGGGHYINRTWRAEPMPHCKDATIKAEVWDKVIAELTTKHWKLDVLGVL
ncbi:hypothetical protein NW762_006367 [Fusarium torreyae]|uniref:Reductase n=1 Tax=Fusarium torreyae TaxID=1237075 RepID=A0A9W8S2G2_9HYPO|nr:hypothetical protein NW762_006367 [Fusarium torreyae]